MKFQKIAVGDPTFTQIVKDNCAYVDKTQFIEMLEEQRIKYPFIIRPRRFGKTLFLNTLRSYYDLNLKERFDELFSGTYIHEHKTALQGSFYILKFDFSGVNKDPDRLLASFTAKVECGISEFFSNYQDVAQVAKPLIKDEYDSPASLISAFCQAVNPITGLNVYLIIDEYDQFTNALLSKNVNVFRNITSSEGFLKDFYAILKERTQNTFSNIFITGVTSISLDSMTSGFNIAENITFNPNFAAMFGFTEDELRALICKTIDLSKVEKSIDEIIATMKDIYNGYRCSNESPVTVYNPSMCLYYLKYLATTGKEPRQLFDPNVTSDIFKIDGILSLAEDRNQISDIISAVLNNESIYMDVQPTQLNMNELDHLGHYDLLSILIYMGYLTWSRHSDEYLCCPNKAVRAQFFSYYFNLIKPNFGIRYEMTDSLVRSFQELNYGNIKPLLKLVADKLSHSFGIASVKNFNEKVIQVAVQMAFLATAKYTATAELEALGKGITDLFIEENGNCSLSRKCWLLEFKYASKAEATDARIKQLKDKAIEQLIRYSTSDTFSTLTNLKRIAVIFSGTELVLAEEV